jgi:thiol-disulfide isomerase/thioredoxin
MTDCYAAHVRRALLLICAACAGRSAHPPPPTAKPAAVPQLAASADPAPITAPSWLGIGTDPKTTRVIQVVHGAPGDRAGVKVGDDIVSIGGEKVMDGKDIVRRARALPAGRQVAIVVRRAGEELTLSVVPEARPEHPEQALIGKPAPPFKFSLQQPAQLSGHVVLLEFWATWCGPCEITAPRLDEWHHRFPDLRIVGVTDEEAAPIAQYVAEHKLAYPVALDPGDATARAYMVQALPTIVLIDKTGIVREVHVGVPNFDALEARIQQLM